MMNDIGSNLNQSFYGSSYRALVKSNITLDQRYKFAELTASVVRKSSFDRWQEIKKNNKKFLPAVEYLRNNGFLTVEIPFALQIVEEILALSNRQVEPQSASLSERNEIFHLKGVQSLPSIQKLLNFKHLYELVSMYLCCPASLYACQAWWQFPSNSKSPPQNSQLWHRDRDDFGFLKLFMNVTEVDYSSGPHCFIKYSHHPGDIKSIYANYESNKHLLDGQKPQFLSDEIMKGLLSNYSPKVWTGSPGFCFLEDTRGFHKASIPTERPRLILSLIWTVKP